MNHYMPMCPYAQQMMPSMSMMEMEKTMPMMMHMQQMMPMMMPMLMEMDDEDDDDDSKTPERIKVEEILEKIEKNDPQVFAIMRAYGIPMFVARRIVRRIIGLTMMYSK